MFTIIKWCRHSWKRATQSNKTKTKCRDSVPRIQTTQNAIHWKSVPRKPTTQSANHWKLFALQQSQKGFWIYHKEWWFLQLNGRIIVPKCLVTLKTNWNIRTDHWSQNWSWMPIGHFVLTENIFQILSSYQQFTFNWWWCTVNRNFYEWLLEAINICSEFLRLLRIFCYRRAWKKMSCSIQQLIIAPLHDRCRRNMCLIRVRHFIFQVEKTGKIWEFGQKSANWELQGIQNYMLRPAKI